MTTDPHFGVSNNDKKRLKIVNDYYKNFFIPTVSKLKGKDDILIVLGDIFDHRSLLDIQVINDVIQTFEHLNEVFKEIYIICGNHDTYRKDTNEINSLKILNQKHLNLDIIYEKPKKLKIKNKDLWLIPWQVNSEEERKVLKEIGKSDYTFAHTSVIGAVYSGSRKVENGNEADSFYNFGKVYTGHIHTTQIIKNVNFIGSPFEITRNDKNNPKYIWYFDIESGNEWSLINNYSPRFITISDEFVLNSKQNEIDSIVQSNFVDLNLTFSPQEDSRKYSKIINKMSLSPALDVKSIYKKEKEEIINLKISNAEDVTNMTQIKHLDIAEELLKTKKLPVPFIEKSLKFLRDKIKEHGGEI